MSDRFHTETPLRPELSELTLAGDEAHHLANVLRAKPGREIRVFDGRGAERRAVVTAVTKQTVQVALHESTARPEEIQPALTLAVALPKGDRQKWLIEKCVELGVARFVPLATARGVAQPVAGALARLRRQVVEAAKQSGGLYCMEIAEPATIGQLAATCNGATLSCIAQPPHAPESIQYRAESAAFDSCMPADWIAQRGERICLIGPEGGFTLEELRAATTSGYRFLDLGPNVLRVETAALAVAAWALAGGRG